MSNKRKNLRKNAQQTSGISDVSIYSWGTSAYGKYLIFNFKSSANTPPITKMIYQILLGTSILDSGTLPYLFNNAQIIYTSQNILDKKVSLAITAAYINNTTSPKATSTPVLLDTSPYINCNYFERDLNVTTTTKARGTFTSVITPQSNYVDISSNANNNSPPVLYTVIFAFMPTIPNGITQISWKNSSDSIYGDIKFNSRNGTPLFPNSTLNGIPHNYSPLTLTKTIKPGRPPTYSIINCTRKAYIEYVTITSDTGFEYIGVIDWLATSTTRGPTVVPVPV
jgi:hypothetical protein